MPISYVIVARISCGKPVALPRHSGGSRHLIEYGTLSNENLHWMPGAWIAPAILMHFLRPYRPQARQDGADGEHPAPPVIPANAGIQSKKNQCLPHSVNVHGTEILVSFPYLGP